MELTKKDYFDKDEWYGEFYKCRNCPSTDIRIGSKFCDECGIKIDWKLEPILPPYEP